MTLHQPVLHLASASPRRRDILTSMGVAFSHGGVDIDETPAPGEDVADMVQRVTRAKALAAEQNGEIAIPVLAADTAVALGDRIFGKPASKEQALDMLGSLSGQAHRVLTAVALLSGGELQTALSVTQVTFREIRPDEALAYWQSGEPRGKAGAYAIQGRGGIFVESLAGSYSGVVGLPVFETAGLLTAAGINVLSSEIPVMQAGHD
jgi:septum formation protein